MANPEVSSTGLTDQRDTDQGRAGKYAILMELGSGGSATVSAAVAKGIAGFSKVVVLKTIRDGLGRDEDTIKMFLAEARLSARMNHPNIVQVYEVFKQKNLPVIVMEYVDGQSLATLLASSGASGHFPPELGVAILVKVLAGLNHAHTLTDYSGEPLHLVHRDVSPQNVMIGYDGQVKLVDFGIAKLKNQSVQTRDGVLKGKLCYMAPEQIHNEIDHRSDIFAIGVILWEILALRRMWGDLGDAAIITRLLTNDIPRLRDVVPDIDPELDRICSKALAPDRERRYARASDMQRDLEAYLGRSAVDVSQQAIGNLLDRSCRALREETQTTLQHKIRSLGMSLSEDVDHTEGNDIAQPSQLVPTPPRHRRWLATAAGAGVVALVGLLALQRALQPEVTVAQTAGPAPAPVVLPEAASPPEAPVVPARVTVNVSVTPLEARLYLDDRRLASNPFRDSWPRDSLEHTFRAQAEGFEEFRKVIRLESDLDITVSMKAAAAGNEAPVALPSRPRPKRQAPPPRVPNPSRPVESPPPPPLATGATLRPSEARDPPPTTIAPGQDLRSTRGAPLRRPVDFDDPYSKK